MPPLDDGTTQISVGGAASVPKGDERASGDLESGGEHGTQVLFAVMDDSQDGGRRNDPGEVWTCMPDKPSDPMATIRM